MFSSEIYHNFHADRAQEENSAAVTGFRTHDLRITRSMLYEITSGRIEDWKL
jgi:hypothetical protein